MRPVVQEELLDDVRLVAEAEHEIAMPVFAVVMHQVPEDRLVADRDHRLRDVFRIIANSGAEASAEQNCLHGLTLCLTAWDSAYPEPSGSLEAPSAQRERE